jgi:hypothetical protein
MSPKVGGEMRFNDAAYKVLKSSRMPLTPTEVAQIAIEKGFIKTNSKRPGATMAARLWGDKERFVSVGDGRWTIKKD